MPITSGGNPWGILEKEAGACRRAVLRGISREGGAAGKIKRMEEWQASWPEEIYK
jgi:hypothetical protein